MGKSREEGDLLGISSGGLQRSLEHVEMCVVLRRAVVLEAEAST